MSLEQTELKWIPPVIQTMFVDVEIAARNLRLVKYFAPYPKLKVQSHK